jgi:hypothetical protein
MKLKESTSVLIFNANKRFCGYSPSINYTANLLGCSKAIVSMVCNGKGNCITAKGYYLRFGTLQDVNNTPTLQEFDKLHGINARYYKTASINRKGLKIKYKKKQSLNITNLQTA